MAKQSAFEPVIAVTIQPHRDRRWAGRFSTVVVALRLLGASPVGAECLIQTPDGVLAEKSHELVFRGRVIEIGRTTQVGYQATFEVDRVWKGSVPNPMQLYVWEQLSELPHFELGRQYIVVAQRLGEGRERSAVGLTAADGVAFAPVMCSDLIPLAFGEKWGPGRPPTSRAPVAPIPLAMRQNVGE